MKLFDAHTHVHFSAFNTDRDEVIKRAFENNVDFINVGTNKKTSNDAVLLAEKYTHGVYATIGLHPIHTSTSFEDDEEGENIPESEFDYYFYKTLATHKKVVAIGECGLDYFHILENDNDAKIKQKEAFIEQIKLAYEVKKPLMIHCRKAYADLIFTLKEQRALLNTIPGIIHFFAGNEEETKEFLELGFYFTFGGVITFVKDYDKVIDMIPQDRILSETDAPYVTPVPFRGKRNEPSYVKYVVNRLAEIKKISQEAMAEKILQNIKKVFVDDKSWP